ncbi:UPF0496 protein At4g34320-like [Cucurbita moschata]|uniref:UPF0496 protein At4g34320-like n=1 Tax=Cucurbita moschata TaxID=3662 RepID=A0A6J1G5X0_CUCMO|nr:UPF0496 protein At4g34320-like [Cucurbita moschata]
MGNSHATKRSTTAAEQPAAINLAAKDLTTYEAACVADADVRSFDKALQARANQVLTTLADDGGVQVRALSFDSLKQVTECLLEMNQEVVRVILQCKKDIWKSQEVFELVEDYFENSLQTLDFCTALENCLKRARDSQLLILMALRQFEEEETHVGRNRFVKTLQELRNFKASADPFTQEFFNIFHSVYKQQMVMLEKLQQKKNKLDKKLKSINTWRKLSSMIFAATFAAVLICSVVATVIAAPPVTAALSAASSIPLGSMGKWIDSLWRSYENALKGQKEVISSMQVGTYIAIKDMDNIRVLVGKVETEMEGMLEKAEFAIEEEAVKVGVEEMKKKLDVFMKSVEDLGVQADLCSKDITRARTVVLQRIIKHPN